MRRKREVVVRSDVPVVGDGQLKAAARAVPHGGDKETGFSLSAHGERKPGEVEHGIAVGNLEDGVLASRRLFVFVQGKFVEFEPPAGVALAAGCYLGIAKD